MAAAVRAACLAKAPRRTIQGVAAAVVSALANPSPAAATPRMVRAETARDPGATSAAGVEEMEHRLRAARADKRRAKRQRRRAAKAAAAKGEPKNGLASATVPPEMGTGSQAPEAAGVSTPRAVPAASSLRGPTGSPPCKKPRGGGDDAEEEAGMTRELSLESFLYLDISGATMYTFEDGASAPRPLSAAERRLRHQRLELWHREVGQRPLDAAPAAPDKDL